MAQRLRELGLAVVKCDNRGSARRGLLFEGALRWNLGDVEVQDQAHAVDFLVRSHGLFEGKRTDRHGGWIDG